MTPTGSDLPEPQTARAIDVWRAGLEPEAVHPGTVTVTVPATVPDWVVAPDRGTHRLGRDAR